MCEFVESARFEEARHPSILQFSLLSCFRVVQDSVESITLIAIVKYLLDHTESVNDFFGAVFFCDTIPVKLTCIHLKYVVKNAFIRARLDDELIGISASVRVQVKAL